MPDGLLRLHVPVDGVRKAGDAEAAFVVVALVDKGRGEVTRRAGEPGEEGEGRGHGDDEEPRAEERGHGLGLWFLLDNEPQVRHRVLEAPADLVDEEAAGSGVRGGAVQDVVGPRVGRQALRPCEQVAYSASGGVSSRQLVSASGPFAAGKAGFASVVVFRVAVILSLFRRSLRSTTGETSVATRRAQTVTARARGEVRPARNDCSAMMNPSSPRPTMATPTSHRLSQSKTPVTTFVMTAMQETSAP
mmetsp:Transcript_26036/g.92862  ORF Transcript_26036/g.92862 Transcript_26036/m.92862 type:complete len:247 (+) Transcript_26036:128-868(+)